MRIIFLALLFALFFTSCENNNDSEIIINDYKNFYSIVELNNTEPIDSFKVNKTFTSYYYFYLNNRISIISGKLVGHDYGHRFFFDKNGKLDKYEYITGFNNTFNITLDGVKNIYTPEGSPFVDYMVFRGYKDSIGICTLLFSQFPWQSLDVLISKKSDNFKPILLKKHGFIPMLLQADIPFRNKDTIFLKTISNHLKVKLKGLNQSETTFDTIYPRENHF